MYKLSNLNPSTSLIRLSDNSLIPPDPLNKDYQDYLAWVDDGNEPFPPDIEPVLIPSSISMRQARLALLSADLLDPINEAFSLMTQADQIEWQFASSIDRNSRLVSNLASRLDISDAELDQLFLLASTL